MDNHLEHRDDSAMLNLITEIHKDVKSLDTRLTEHMNSETLTLATEVAKMMKSAFPDGDADGHRKRHELELQNLKSKIEFRDKMLFELTRWGLFGMLGWLAVVAWRAFLKGP